MQTIKSAITSFNLIYDKKLITDKKLIKIHTVRQLLHNEKAALKNLGRSHKDITQSAIKDAGDKVPQSHTHRKLRTQYSRGGAFPTNFFCINFVWRFVYWFLSPKQLTFGSTFLLQRSHKFLDLPNCNRFWINESKHFIFKAFPYI